jgi:ABC-type dipeptide/oligopeptide/nickel transport system permease component
MVFASKQGIKFVLTSLTFILIGCLPGLFQGVHVDLMNYVDLVKRVTMHLFHPTYVDGELTRPLFPNILAPYFYSMKILFGGLILSLIWAFLGLFLTFFLPKKAKQVIHFIAFLGESLPDILVISIFEIIVIWIYERTGLLVMNLSQSMEDIPYILPILCLSFIPACFFYRMMLVNLKEQLEMDYIEMAKSKGLRPSAILSRHILRNMAAPLLSYSRTIVWMMLSNLVIFEYIFSSAGITRFMYTYHTSLVFTIGMFLIYVPFFIFYVLLSIVLKQITGREAL